MKIQKYEASIIIFGFITESQTLSFSSFIDGCIPEGKIDVKRTILKMETLP